MQFWIEHADLLGPDFDSQCVPIPTLSNAGKILKLLR